MNGNNLFILPAVQPDLSFGTLVKTKRYVYCLRPAQAIFMMHLTKKNYYDRKSTLMCFFYSTGRETSYNINCFVVTFLIFLSRVALAFST